MDAASKEYQFPSELFSTVGTYKTQSASLIEGGVAGQISLESVPPLDYGRRRIQGELKLNYNPQNFDIDEDQRLQDLGYRATGSLVDQFDIGGDRWVISLGFSRNEQTNPEQEANVSNTVNYCLNDPTNTSVGVYNDQNCDSPRPAVAGTEDFVIAQNGYSYRQGITDVFSVDDAIGTANATGNPFTDPLLSWNFDAAIEWYPDPDSILALGAYYKSFNGGFETIGRFETFTVDGQELGTLVTALNTSDDTSTIFGIEVTAAHRLCYLPRPLDGVGFKLSYNFADTDFLFWDDALGALTTVNADGSTTTSEALIPPAGLFGFSRHVLSA